MHTPYLMPAAGWLRTPEDLQRIAGLDTIYATMAGSFTLPKRDGNPEPTFIEIEPGSWVNSLGMPNGGLEYLHLHINDMVEASGDKPLHISIAPITSGDLQSMASFLSKTAISTIELNAGCPNVWGDDKRHAIISHDLKALEQAVSEVMIACGTKRVAVKLSPLPDDIANEIVRMLDDFGVDEVVIMNTRPDYPTSGILSMPSGGLSGKAIQEEAVRQVSMVRNVIDRIGSSMRLVGVGGIDSGNMLKRHFDAGADAAQIGTHAQVYGPKVFGEIIGEYIEASIE